jgi:hypothetical protein
LLLVRASTVILGTEALTSCSVTVLGTYHTTDIVPICPFPTHAHTHTHTQPALYLSVATVRVNVCGQSLRPDVITRLCLQPNPYDYRNVKVTQHDRRLVRRYFRCQTPSAAQDCQTLAVLCLAFLYDHLNNIMDSVCTSQEAHYISTTETDQLTHSYGTLIHSVVSSRLCIVTVDGIYSYHCMYRATVLQFTGRP